MKAGAAGKAAIKVVGVVKAKCYLPLKLQLSHSPLDTQHLALSHHTAVYSMSATTFLGNLRISSLIISSNF